LSGAVATLHVTPTSIVGRCVCSTFLLTIRTRAASFRNRFAVLFGENIACIFITGFLSGAVATFHLTPTSIVGRWVCSTFLLAIRTRAASFRNRFAVLFG